MTLVGAGRADQHGEWAEAGRHVSPDSVWSASEGGNDVGVVFDVTATTLSRVPRAAGLALEAALV